MEGSMRFAHTLKAVRNGKGKNQSKLAEDAGLDHSYISRLENGDRWPTRAAVNDISYALDATKDERGLLLVAAGFADEDDVTFHMDPVVYQIGVVLLRLDGLGPAGETWATSTRKTLEQIAKQCQIVAQAEERNYAGKR